MFWTRVLHYWRDADGTSLPTKLSVGHAVEMQQHIWVLVIFGEWGVFKLVYLVDGFSKGIPVREVEAG